MTNKQLSLMKQSTGFYQIAAQDLDEKDLISAIVSLTLATEETTGTPAHTILGSAFEVILNYKRSNNQEFENKKLELLRQLKHLEQAQLSFDSLYHPASGAEDTVKERVPSISSKSKATQPLKQKKWIISLSGIKLFSFDLNLFRKNGIGKKEEENLGIFQFLVRDRND